MALCADVVLHGILDRSDVALCSGSEVGAVHRDPERAFLARPAAASALAGAAIHVLLVRRTHVYIPDIHVFLGLARDFQDQSCFGSRVFWVISRLHAGSCAGTAFHFRNASVHPCAAVETLMRSRVCAGFAKCSGRDTDGTEGLCRFRKDNWRGVASNVFGEYAYTPTPPPDG